MIVDAAYRPMKSATVVLTLLLAVSPVSRGEPAHPQITYGAIHLPFFIEQEVHAKPKSQSISSLLVQLGELVEDDPDYEEKKHELIKLLKESRERS